MLHEILKNWLPEFQIAIQDAPRNNEKLATGVSNRDPKWSTKYGKTGYRSFKSRSKMIHEILKNWLPEFQITIQNGQRKTEKLATGVSNRDPKWSTKY